MSTGQGTSRAETSGGTRRRVLRWLKPLFAIAILAIVVRGLPFRDQLEWIPAAPGEEVLSVPGKIVGDWKDDTIRFERDAEAELPEGLPPGVIALLESEASVEVERGPGRGVAGGDFDWKPGMPRAFSSMEPSGLLLAFGSFLVALMWGTTRWWRLLGLSGCVTTWFNTLRLTFLGLFFNLVVPGLTGGDLVKAVLVTREHPGRRAVALVTVVVDRVIGLLTLVALCAVVVLIEGGAFEPLRLPVLLVLAAGVGGTLVYVNRPLRRLVRYDALLEKLPGSEKLQQIDDALVQYTRHPLELLVAIVLSLGNHFFAVLGVVFLGKAFGATPSVLQYFILAPVANIVSALPLSPGGWGLGEATYKELFELIGASATLGVAISVTFRLMQAVLSLVGGLFLFLPGKRLHLKELEELEEEAREAELAPETAVAP